MKVLLFILNLSITFLCLSQSTVGSSGDVYQIDDYEYSFNIGVTFIETDTCSENIVTTGQFQPSISPEFYSVGEMNENLISLYPNPVNDVIFIDSDQLVMEYSLYNVLGEKILHNTIIDKQGINVQSLEPSTYFLEVITVDNLKYMAKFIKL